MKRFWIGCTLVVIVSVSTTLSEAQVDPFSTQIRPTPKLSPEAQQKTFRLPPGFEIQAFAADPQINKPLNTAFDADGRLWITDTVEYPHPVAVGKKGRDSVKILEDTTGDGKADKITTFAEGLNIPMGLLPYGDGVIVFSIPNIWHLRDTTGDGKADKREVLYGPVGYEQDTHGLHNSFRRHFSGWIHANHGFNNDTTVSGTDGNQVVMNSGNTYRFKLDGSRVEHYTHGQVNPFGTAVDPLGNLFTADCHSKPVYQLLQGGYYPSFGKKDDGLGFVPPMMDHQHGSTAIAGLTVYIGENFPPEYRGNTFSGNVMTSRVNRDTLEFHGSTIIAKEADDFIVCQDPWFRPVDIQTGPDGALYIADFYNKIIGHYEVDLNHPERDRKSGRIWRVIYKGDHPESKPAKKVTRLSEASLETLIENLGHPTLTQRLSATHEIVDRFEKSEVSAVTSALNTNENPFVRSHALWVLKRLGALSQKDLQHALKDSQAMVRTHATKVLAETADWSPLHYEMVYESLKDKDAFVQRAAAEGLSLHPHPDNISHLVQTLVLVPKEDNHLRQMIRIALKNNFKNESILENTKIENMTEAEAHETADVLLAVRTKAAAIFIQNYLGKYQPNPQQSARLLVVAANMIPADKLEELIPIARKQSVGNLKLQRDMIMSIQAGLKKRGTQLPSSLQDWAKSIISDLLQDSTEQLASWKFRALPGSSDVSIPWGFKDRKSAQTGTNSRFLDSFVYGEQGTGILLSKTFKLPNTFQFDLAGHMRIPSEPANNKNKVRLRLATDNKILHEEFVPRSDVAKTVKWDLTQWAGQEGYLEIIDGDSGGSYAWIAVGNFSNGILKFPSTSPRSLVQSVRNAAHLIREFDFQEYHSELQTLLAQERYDNTTHWEIASTILKLQPNLEQNALLGLLDDIATPDLLRHDILHTIAGIGPTKKESNAAEHLAVAFKTVPQRLQLEIAENLAASQAGQNVLLDLISSGKASPRLLRRNTVRDRLLSGNPSPELRDQVDELTKRLPAVKETLAALIVERVKQQTASKPNLENGKAMFLKHCAICHKIGTEGVLVGPQLDGIGARGAERLIEDALDPNRNVDASFRSTTVVMESGLVHSGLIRRTEGSYLVMVDNKGKEFSLPIDEIDEKITSKNSLMPENVSELLSEKEFHDLIGYLLTQKVK